MTIAPNGPNIFPVWGGNGILGYSSLKTFDEMITLLTCRGSNCGLIKATSSPCWVSNNSFACKSNYGSQYFLYTYFLHEDFSECVTGSAQPQITYTALKNKAMRFPLSRIIAKHFSDRVDSSHKKKQANEKQIESLAKLRDTLLPKLLSGELRIPDAEKLMAEADA